MVGYMHGKACPPPECDPGGELALRRAPRLNARDLLSGGREVILVYKDFEYRLRLTSNDKLILTK